MAGFTSKRRKYCQVFILLNVFAVLAVVLLSSSWRVNVGYSRIVHTQRKSTVAGNETRQDVTTISLQPVEHKPITQKYNPVTNVSGFPVVKDAQKLPNNNVYITNETLQGYVAITDFNKHLQHRRCGQCAIVSSSGRIVGRHAGKEIDQSDCVIRMNDAPIKGYERDVGMRTTTRIISFASLGVFEPSKLFDPATSPKTILFWGPSAWMDKEKNGTGYYKISQYQKQFPHIQFYKFTDERMTECHTIYENATHLKIGGIWASTGWFTMLFARQICDNVTVYGMTSPNYCQQHPRDMTPYHYYNKVMYECSRFRQHERSKKNVHKYKTERTVFHEWNEAKVANITFRHPSW